MGAEPIYCVDHAGQFDAGSCPLCKDERIADLERNVRVWIDGDGNEVELDSAAEVMERRKAAATRIAELESRAGAPVQGFGFIPWEMHYRAWERYAKNHGTRQSAKRIAERGGFGVEEMNEYVPAWRTELHAIDQHEATKRRVKRLAWLHLNHAGPIGIVWDQANDERDEFLLACFEDCGGYDEALRMEQGGADG